jgi:hypothetical protein
MVEPALGALGPHISGQVSAEAADVTDRLRNGAQAVVLPSHLQRGPAPHGDWTSTSRPVAVAAVSAEAEAIECGVASGGQENQAGKRLRL